MLLLAAKLGILTSVSGQLSASENATWQKIRTSIGTLTRNGISLGPAVFIGADGSFVANTLVVQKGATDLITDAGLDYKFKVEATDSASQLTLLRTTIRPAGITVVRAADRSDGEKGTILAVLPRQLVRAEITGTEKIGIDQKSKRTFPIQEIRVEQPALQMGGALLFSQNGRLIGGFFAALPQDGANQQGVGNIGSFAQNVQKLPAGKSQGGLGGQATQGGGGFGGGAGRDSGSNSLTTRNYGPQGLLVGYSPTWEVTAKAISGFLSPDKRAHYGLLGVFIIDNKFGGVEIQSITKDSSADLGGLEVGDVIVEISGVPILNQIDFSRASYRLAPGTTIPVKVRRKVEIITLEVTVGTQHLQLDGHQLSSIARFDSPEIR